MAWLLCVNLNLIMTKCHVGVSKRQKYDVLFYLSNFHLFCAFNIGNAITYY